MGTSLIRSLRPLLLAVVAFPALSASSACTGNPARPTVAERDTASLQARLTAGPWRLVEYRPDLPLDPVTQALLDAQIRTMVLTFDGQTMRAQSPTFSFSRPYTLENVAEFVFDMESPSASGARNLRSHCEIDPSGRRITFHAQSDPWNGTGVIEREGP